MSKARRRSRLARLALVLLIASNARADDGFNALLTKFAARIASAEEFRVEARETWESTGGANEVAQSGATRYEMAVARPGRFAIRAWPAEDEAPSIEVGSDGETLVTLVRGTHPLHARSKPRGPAESVGRNPLLSSGLAGSFFGALLRPDLADFVADSVENLADLGVETVGEPAVPTRHFRGAWSDGRTVDFWCVEGDAPALAQLRLTRVVPSVAPDGPEFRLTQTTRYSWTFGPVDPTLFRVEPGKESKEVDDLYAAVTGAGEALALGAKAPPIDLDVLGGGRLNLADHEGREVVVLNFWASWYPIGLESLATVSEFAREFGPKGAAFYQINLAEPQAVVERTLAALKLPLVVALDPQGRTMESYSVRALPFSVLIGKNGTVQAVNAGDLRDFKERFREQVEALLAGRPIPPPK